MATTIYYHYYSNILLVLCILMTIATIFVAKCDTIRLVVLLLMITGMLIFCTAMIQFKYSSLSAWICLIILIGNCCIISATYFFQFRKKSCNKKHIKYLRVLLSCNVVVFAIMIMSTIGIQKSELSPNPAIKTTQQNQSSSINKQKSPEITVQQHERPVLTKENKAASKPILQNQSSSINKQKITQTPISSDTVTTDLNQSSSINNEITQITPSQRQPKNKPIPIGRIHEFDEQFSKRRNPNQWPKSILPYKSLPHFYGKTEEMRAQLNQSRANKKEEIKAQLTQLLQNKSKPQESVSTTADNIEQKEESILDQDVESTTNQPSTSEVDSEALKEKAVYNVTYLYKWQKIAKDKGKWQKIAKATQNPMLHLKGNKDEIQIFSTPQGILSTSIRKQNKLPPPRIPEKTRLKVQWKAVDLLRSKDSENFEWFAAKFKQHQDAKKFQEILTRYAEN